MNRWERYVRQAHIEAESIWIMLLNEHTDSDYVPGLERRFKALDARNTLVYVMGRLVAGDGVTPRTASPGPRVKRGDDQ